MKRRKKRSAEDSNLEAEGEQPWLLEVEPHVVEAEGRTTKRCTGQLLFERYRETYDAVVTALAGGGSVRTCMKLFGIGTHTVLAIARRERLEVATRKGDLATAMMLGAEVFAERAIELAPDCESAYEAAGTAKMLAETSNLMRGQATSISAGVIIHVDAAAAAASLQEKAQKMGFGGGQNLGMAALGAPVVRAAVPLRGAMDIQSADSMAYVADYQCIKIDGDPLGDTSRDDDGAIFEGGGGGAGANSCPAP